MAFHLQSLLDLRRNAEEGARLALEAAIASRREEEERQARLQARRQEAHDSVERERSRLAAGPTPNTPAQARTREQYLQRLRDEAAQLSGAAEEHRSGPLAASLAAEGSARAEYEEARKSYEAVEKLREHAEAEAKKTNERRAEESAADLAQAAFFRRGSRGPGSS